MFLTIRLALQPIAIQVYFVRNITYLGVYIGRIGLSTDWNRAIPSGTGTAHLRTLLLGAHG